MYHEGRRSEGFWHAFGQGVTGVWELLIAQKARVHFAFAFHSYCQSFHLRGAGDLARRTLKYGFYKPRLEDTSFSVLYSVVQILCRTVVGGYILCAVHSCGHAPETTRRLNLSKLRCRVVAARRCKTMRAAITSGIPGMQ
jgi:hypothetical protein